MINLTWFTFLSLFTMNFRIQKKKKKLGEEYYRKIISNTKKLTNLIIDET